MKIEILIDIDRLGEHWVHELHRIIDEDIAAIEHEEEKTPLYDNCGLPVGTAVIRP